MKTSWRCLEKVLKTSWRGIAKTNILVFAKTSWRRLEDVFWRHKAKVNMFVLIKTSWRRFQDVFWRRRRKTSSRRLHDVFIKTNVCWEIWPVNILFASETSWRRLQDMSSRRLARGLENVFKTSSRRLGRRKIVTLKTCWRHLQDMSWRRLQDLLKTNKCLLGSHCNRRSDIADSLAFFKRFPVRFKVPMCSDNLIKKCQNAFP